MLLATSNLINFYICVNLFVQDGAEFAKMYNGYQSRPNRVGGKPFVPTTSVKDLPATVDWRTKGYVTGVKNQVSLVNKTTVIIIYP